MKAELMIGIDPGTSTGFAVYHPRTKKLLVCSTLMLHRAMEAILNYLGRRIPTIIPVPPGTIDFTLEVIVEDARLIKLPRRLQSGPGKEQGVGSVKRDSKIWNEFLADLQSRFPGQLRYRMADPRANRLKRMDEPGWRQMTGWAGRTSEHARAAATYVWGG